MAGNIHNENKIVIPFLGVIYLASLVIVIIQHFAKDNFGAVGVIAWIIVILGSLAFIYNILSEIFG